MTIPVLIIATVVTQAFSFETIRTLEGYWRGPASLAGTFMICWHVRRKQRISKRYAKATAAAFYAARPRMLTSGITFALVNAMEAQVLGTDPPPLAVGEETALAQMNWRDLCDSWRLARVDRLRKDAESYPIDSRVMPTKLGNLMRTTEDQLQHADGDPQSFAFRRRGTVPYRVRIQHDQFRDRLEMYCTLVFVSAALTALTPVILAGSRPSIGPIVAVSGCFAILAQVSYLAARASARGYCAVLKQMDGA